MDLTSIPTDTSTATGTDAALLRLLWLASPALPVGGFSYSEGLEAAVEATLVRDEGTAAEWLAQQLHATLARADLAVVALAAAASRKDDRQALGRLDTWVRQTRETSELRQQTEQMGRSMREWQRSLGQADPGPEFTYPVAFAVAAASSGASVRAIALAYAFGWSENMMQAAIKSVPLGQGAGQRILARLAREIEIAVDHALSLDAGGLQSFTPMLAILSARHETQYSRLFRS